MTTHPKPRRPVGRLSQLSKRNRLTARALGQWKPEPQQVRNSPLTRYALEEALWKEGV